MKFCTTTFRTLLFSALRRSNEYAVVSIGLPRTILTRPPGRITRRPLGRNFRVATDTHRYDGQPRTDGQRHAALLTPGEIHTRTTNSDRSARMYPTIICAVL